jgi:hypothetical protein
VKCWGFNSEGEVGDGEYSWASTVPVDVWGLTTGVMAVSAGDFHTCALTTVGGVKCWGINNIGQLGNGNDGPPSSLPVDVSGLTTGVMAVSGGDFHTCALTTAGGVKCWGWNVVGQLGDGTTTDSHTPVDVSGLTSGATVVSTFGDSACAVTASGGLKCWGGNEYGQLGNGTTTNSSIPVDVSGLTSGVSAVSVNVTTCAAVSLRDVKCWGDNNGGQVGDGTIGNPVTSSPVEVSGSRYAGATATLHVLHPTTYQDTAAKIVYNGWKTVTDSSASGGAYRASKGKGDRATFVTPAITSLTWLTHLGPDQGLAEVTIDGVSQGTFDLYAAAASAGSFPFSGLSAQAHTMVVTALGKRDASSTGNWVGVDGFQVGSTVTEESSTQILYDTWKGVLKHAASGGSYRKSGFSSGIVSLTFTGTGVEWITAQGPAFGRAQVTIDGVTQPTVDLYQASTTWRWAITYAGLSAGTHTITVRPLGTKNPSSSSTSVVLDAFVALS